MIIYLIKGKNLSNIKKKVYIMKFHEIIIIQLLMRLKKG